MYVEGMKYFVTILQRVYIHPMFGEGMKYLGTLSRTLTWCYPDVSGGLNVII